MYQPKDRMDMEIEELSMLMVKMSQRRHEEGMKIYISRANKQKNNRRQMTKEYCRIKSSGALQHKVWKPGELRMTKKKEHDEMNDQLQSKIWDPGILNMEVYDQGFIFLFFLGSLMQEHPSLNLTTSPIFGYVLEGVFIS